MKKSTLALALGSAVVGYAVGSVHGTEGHKEVLEEIIGLEDGYVSEMGFPGNSYSGSAAFTQSLPPYYFIRFMGEEKPFPERHIPTLDLFDYRNKGDYELNDRVSAILSISYVDTDGDGKYSLGWDEVRDHHIIEIKKQEN